MNPCRTISKNTAFDCWSISGFIAHPHLYSFAFTKQSFDATHFCKKSATFRHADVHIRILKIALKLRSGSIAAVSGIKTPSSECGDSMTNARIELSKMLLTEWFNFHVVGFWIK